MHGDEEIIVHQLPERFVDRSIGFWIFVGPIHEQGFADNFLPMHKPPIPAVIAVIAVIAHHEKTIRRHNDWAVVIADLELFRSPRIRTVRRRIHMDLVRLVELYAVDVYRFVSNLNCFSGKTNHAFHEWDVPVGGGFEGDDIEPTDRSMRKIGANGSWIVRGKRYLVEKEMIADKDGRFHGFRRYLRCLRDVAREN